MAPMPPHPDHDADAQDLRARGSAAQQPETSGNKSSGGASGGGRFNVLLTEDREHAIEHWTHQLSRLLEPQGVSAFVARSGRDALDIASEIPIHAAIVDIATPRERTSPSAASPTGGLWLLEVLNRQPQRPPVVVVNGRPYAPREAQRMLNEALRLGASSVLNTPVHIEALLHTIRRLLEREYRGAWPTTPPPEAASPEAKHADQTPASSLEQSAQEPRIHKATFRFSIKFNFNKRPPDPQH